MPLRFFLELLAGYAQYSLSEIDCKVRLEKLNKRIKKLNTQNKEEIFADLRRKIAENDNYSELDKAQLSELLLFCDDCGSSDNSESFEVPLEYYRVVMKCPYMFSQIIETTFDSKYWIPIFEAAPKGQREADWWDMIFDSNN